MNLKAILMELGNRLVTERGFVPGLYYPQKGEGDTGPSPIIQFTEWLNNTPEAIAILEEMGIEWPVVKR